MGRKMTVGVGALALLAALTGSAAADHWNDNDGDDVSDAAGELASEAKQFAKAAHKAGPSNQLDDKASDLAESANVLEEVVQSGWGPFFINNTWEEVQARYQKLQKAWKNAHNLHHKATMKKAWKELRSAYQDLESAMDGDSDWDNDDNDWNDDDDNDWDDDHDPWTPDDDIDIVLF